MRVVRYIAQKIALHAGDLIPEGVQRMGFFTNTAVGVGLGCLGAALPWQAWAATDFPPRPGTVSHGYEGAPRPQAQVATVFMTDGLPNYEAGFVCTVNQQPAVRDGGCASAAHLLPGQHRLGLRYLSRIEQGELEVGLRVEAGRLYQLNFTSFRTNHRGAVSLIPMAPGARLIYRHLSPSAFPSAQLDQPVPYEAP
jgi:hypothetical protein